MDTIRPQVSIILPTYNESQNILEMLRHIKEIIPRQVSSQTIVVDDNSPDGTGHMVEEYVKNTKKATNHDIEILHNKTKTSLSSAILDGIRHAKGDTVVVMDCDLSHPPQLIPKLIEVLRHRCDIAIASRYIRGGKIVGLPTKRRWISRLGTLTAKFCLGIKETDPMSGFFACRRSLFDGISFDGWGFKILMELIIKAKGARIVEIPYTFQERKFGKSKLGLGVLFTYVAAVWKLYWYNNKKESRTSVQFFSKAGRFYTVGASGFLLNYLVSHSMVANLDVWYVHANLLGIVLSMSSNFLLDKIWTFRDRCFGLKKTLTQYAKFAGFSSLGAVVQILIVFSAVEGGWSYSSSLIVGVLSAALGNFILNKKWTFKEKIWG